MTETGSEGYTIILDWVVRKCGARDALIYGVVLRYCQMREGVCFASTSTMGKHIGMSRQCFARGLRRLVDAGLIADKTPDAEGATHVYTVVPGGVAIDEPVTPHNTPTCNAPLQPVTPCNTTCYAALQPPVTPCNTRITIEETSSSSTPAAAPHIERDPDVIYLFGLVDRVGVMVGGQLQEEQWRGLLEITRDHDLLAEAFAEAAQQPRQPNVRYIRSILERCIAEGRRPGARDSGQARAAPAVRAEQIAPGVFRMPVSTAHLRGGRRDGET